MIMVIEWSYEISYQTSFLVTWTCTYRDMYGPMGEYLHLQLTTYVGYIPPMDTARGSIIARG